MKLPNVFLGPAVPLPSSVFNRSGLVLNRGTQLFLPEDDLSILRHSSRQKRNEADAIFITPFTRGPRFHRRLRDEFSSRRSSKENFQVFSPVNFTKKRATTRIYQRCISFQIGPAILFARRNFSRAAFFSSWSTLIILIAPLRRWQLGWKRIDFLTLLHSFVRSQSNYTISLTLRNMSEYKRNVKELLSMISGYNVMSNIFLKRLETCFVCQNKGKIEMSRHREE